MAFKFVVFLCAVAYAKAGLLAAPAAAVTYSGPQAVSHVSYSSPLVSYGSHNLPAVTTQQQNILRSPGNLAQVSTYSKTIDTPFSSVSKHDVRVSNPGYVSTVHAPVATYAAAPVAHYATQYAAPLVTKTIAAPVATYATSHYAAPVLTKTIAAPVATYAASPVATYAAAPVVAKAAIAAPLGVAYSAAPAVSHMTYSNGLGLTYGW